MSVLNSLLRIGIGVLLLLGPGLAIAGSTCVFGIQDNTCLQRIVSAPEVASTCSTGAGYQTVTPAAWEGSYWSQPVCSYTPAPSCPSGDTETTQPTWNGSSWVGQVCTLVSTPPSGPVCSYSGNTYLEIYEAAGEIHSRAPEVIYGYLVIGGETLWSKSQSYTVYPTGGFVYAWTVTQINDWIAPYGYQEGSTLESTSTGATSTVGQSYVVYYFNVCTTN